ncbi:glycosyltransferase family 4 protein [Mariniblastus sp.]|nr:glycosyltransferase family 4 protein [Mariniblastus sp.]
MKRVLFLYSRVSGYFLRCVEELTARGCAVTLINWPTHSEAPFKIQLPKGCNAFRRDELSEKRLIDIARDFEPDLIFTSGWMDSGYLECLRKLKPKTPVILMMDTKWRGNIKQQCNCLLSKLKLGPSRLFTHAWVAGTLQAKYAYKLGIPRARVKLGVYCADTANFAEIFARRDVNKIQKRFLYVGRYVQRKGLEELWKAFTNFREKMPDWELHCVGTGEGWDQRPCAKGIVHHGFQQPSQLEPILQSAAAFVMPSRFEAWGVALQEMAVSGLPLIASSEVGACERFLEDNRNGFLTLPRSVKSIETALQRFSTLSMSEVKQMGSRSHKLGISYTPKHWADNALSFLQFERPED